MGIPHRHRGSQPPPLLHIRTLYLVNQILRGNLKQAYLAPYVRCNTRSGHRGGRRTPTAKKPPDGPLRRKCQEMQKQPPHRKETPARGPSGAGCFCLHGVAQGTQQLTQAGVAVVVCQQVARGVDHDGGIRAAISVPPFSPALQAGPAR